LPDGEKKLTQQTLKTKKKTATFLKTKGCGHLNGFILDPGDSFLGRQERYPGRRGLKQGMGLALLKGAKQLRLVGGSMRVVEVALPLALSGRLGDITYAGDEAIFFQ